MSVASNSDNPRHHWIDSPGRWKVLQSKDGRAEMSWTPTLDMANSVGGPVHGGVIATIVDEVTAAAVLSLIESTSLPTISMTLDYLDPVPIGETQTVVGEVIRMGRATAVADARILSAKGKMLARGTCIFQIPRAP